MMDVYDTLLPPPMIPGANAGDTECLLDEDFRDLATSHNVRLIPESPARYVEVVEAPGTQAPCLSVPAFVSCIPSKHPCSSHSAANLARASFST